MRATLIIAAETWRRVSAARATLAFALLFSLLAVGLSYFGLAGQRTAGFQGLARVTASLLNLVIYVVPLTALIMGATEVTGRRAELSLVLAQPVGRAGVLVGTYLGLAGALALALLTGLGGAGLLIALQTHSAALGGYLALVGTSLGLLLAFLSMSFLVGVVLLDRLRAMAASILIWFAAVIGYDLLLIGVTAILRGLPLRTLLIPAIALNPVDITRVLVTLASGRGALFGPAGAVLVQTFGRPFGATLAVLALCLQILLPLLVAFLVFRRRDL